MAVTTAKFIIATFLIAFFCTFTEVRCETDLSRFFRECPCIKPFGDSIRNYSAIDVSSCYVACLAEKLCVGFSYSVSTRECMIFGYDILGYTTEAIRNRDCAAYPSEQSTSTRKWYWVLEDDMGTTTSCADIQSNSPGAASGRFSLRIRGRQLIVHCRMDVTPAETYVDLYALSKWGGSPYLDRPERMEAVTVEYSKALLVYDSCVLAIDRSNTQFRTGTESVGEDTMDIGGGGNCWGSAAAGALGMHEINLESSPIQFAPGLKFEYSGYEVEIVNSTLTAKFSKTTGFGGCGSAKVFSTDGDNLGEYIPVQLQSID